jgi:hypothetical protein
MRAWLRRWSVTLVIVALPIIAYASYRLVFTEDNISADRTAALIDSLTGISVPGTWHCSSWSGDGAEGLSGIDYLCQIPGRPETRTAVATNAHRITGWEPLAM